MPDFGPEFVERIAAHAAGKTLGGSGGALERLASLLGRHVFETPRIRLSPTADGASGAPGQVDCYSLRR